MANNKPHCCRSGDDSSSQSGKNAVKFQEIGLTDSLLLKNNGNTMTTKSGSGHPMSSDNYKNCEVQVPTTSARNNEVQ